MGRSKESVWDYPRPPRLERDDRHLRVEFGGIVLADTRSAIRVLETSHPPVFYLPGGDVVMEHLFPSPMTSWCEFKGRAAYWTVEVGEHHAENAVWGYPAPARGYEQLAGHFAFYPSLMDRCLVDDEEVVPQEGDFYGGWITSEIEGPFKGGPGTLGW